MTRADVITSSSASRTTVAAERAPGGRMTFLVSLPTRALLALVWVYQRTLSPALPVILGPTCGCRFAPTCSHYAAEALREHGAVIGSFLTLRRLLKCSPLHPGGFDPVPLRRSRPVCRAVHSPLSHVQPSAG